MNVSNVTSKGQLMELTLLRKTKTVPVPFREFRPPTVPRLRGSIKCLYLCNPLTRTIRELKQ